MMGLGYAVGFSFSGLKFGITLGLFFGILNIVPFLGTILGILSVFAVSYLQTGGILDSGQWMCSGDVSSPLRVFRCWKVTGLVPK